MTKEQVAEIVHESNKVYCEQLKDYSQVHWALAPNNIKQSAIAAVQYKLDNPNATPEDQHEAWSKFKLEDGWVYGETKDGETKTHPCLVPYEELPEDQKIKDYLFAGIVKALSKFVN